MVRLPALVFRTQIKGTRVLEVWRKNDGLIAGLTGQLDTQVPRVERHESEFVIFGQDMLLGEGIESVNGIAE